MTQHDNRASDSLSPKWADASVPAGDGSEVIPLSAARARATEEAAAVIARELNGPMTALMLYMRELKQQSHQLAHASGNRTYLQQVVDNALLQTERVYALVKRLSDGHVAPVEPAERIIATEGLGGGAWDREPGVMVASD